MLQDFERQVTRYVRSQMVELIQNCGPIHTTWLGAISFKRFLWITVGEIR